MKWGEYCWILSRNWHVGCEDKECESEFSYEHFFSNDNRAFSQLLRGPLPVEIAWMRQKVTEARGASVYAPERII